MAKSRRGPRWAFAVALVCICFGPSACTAILGDFSLSDAIGGADGGAHGGSDATTVTFPDASPAGTNNAEAGLASDSGGSTSESSNGCRADQLACAAGCVSSDDIHNCGACGNDCTLLAHVGAAGLSCVAGQCQFTCTPGYAHCSTPPSDGCETDLSAPVHCGSCTTQCPSTASMCAGSGGTFACTNGCPSGTTPCSGSCADLASDDPHCGTCAMACTGGMTCQSSQCSCVAPFTSCGGTCYSTGDDPTHCGASCTACPVPTNGKATCTDGACGTQCNSGFSACGGSAPCAYDTNVDSSHCGTSCLSCGAGEVCSGGACTCAPGYDDCSGVCTDTQNDRQNCGYCGHVCATNCSGGACACAPTVCSGHICGCGGTCCGSGCCAPP